MFHIGFILLIVLHIYNLVWNFYLFLLSEVLSLSDWCNMRSLPPVCRLSNKNQRGCWLEAFILKLFVTELSISGKWHKLLASISTTKIATIWWTFLTTLVVLYTANVHIPIHVHRYVYRWVNFVRLEFYTSCNKLHLSWLREAKCNWSRSAIKGIDGQ
jgi:hypothetical protein